MPSANDPLALQPPLHRRLVVRERLRRRLALPRGPEEGLRQEASCLGSQDEHRRLSTPEEVRGSIPGRKIERQGT
eukprot:6909363-Pyramimonas_sp.AAC.1